MKRNLMDYFEILKVRNVAVLAITTLFYAISFGYSIFTLFYIERGLNLFEIFLLESILSASIFIFEVPSGFLADRIGRKKLILLAVVAYALSAYITAISHSFLMFAIESVFYGIGIASMSGADSALIYDSLKEHNKEQYSEHAFSLIYAASTAAIVISLPIGSILAQYALEIPVYTTCITATIAIVVVLFLKEAPIEGSVKGENKSRFWGNLQYIMKEKPALIALQAMNSIGFSAVLSLHYLDKLLYKSYGIDVKYFGFILLLIHILSMVFTLGAPSLRRGLGVGKVLLLANLIPGILMLFLWQNTSRYLGICLIALIIGLSSVKGPVYMSFLNKQVDKRDRATILSIISFIGSVVGMFTKPLIGYISNTDLRLTFVVLGVALVVVALAMWAIVKYLQAKEVETNGILEDTI